MDSELLVRIEDALREKFGDGIKVEQSVDDSAGTVRIAVYREVQSFAHHIILTKSLVEQYNSGTLLA